MIDPNPSLLDYISAIGAILTPLLVLTLTALGWRLRHDLERRSNLEAKLHDDRINTYNEILEPFIILFTPDKAWESNPENKRKDKDHIAQLKLLSLDYRRFAFKMTLVGDDDVVKAYNDLMQYSFTLSSNRTHQGEVQFDPKELLSLLGTFLLEIRRSVGNEETKLNKWDMLEWMITDARKMRI